MSIRLPDIVQRVVLDTRSFSAGNKGVGKELAATASEADKFTKSADESGKASRRAGQGHQEHASRLSKVTNAARSASPSILRLADNLYKSRRATDEVGRSKGRLSGILGRLTKFLKTAAISVATMGAKMLAMTFLAAGAVVAVGALGGALVALATSAGGLLGVLPALSGGLLGLVGIGASLKLMFTGVKGAMKQQAQAGGQAKSAAKAQRSAAKSIETAQKAIITAQKAVVKARRDEAEAAEAVGETVYREQRRIADAQEAVVRAEQTRAEALAKTRQAQDKLSKSYEVAARNLIDVARAAERADIAQRRAVQGERGAQKALIDALGSGDIDAIIDAQLNLESARLDTLDATDGLADAEKSLADAEKKGIAKSDAVTEAKIELADANREAEDASREYLKAQVDLIDTEREAAKAVRDAMQARVDAAERVKEAQADLAEAYRGVAEARADAAEGVDSGGSGGGSNEPPPSKEAVAIAKALGLAKKQLTPIREMVQQLTFRDVIKGIEGGTKVIGKFKGQLGITAKLISGQLAALPAVIDRNVPALQRVWGANNLLLNSANGLFNSFVDGAITMADAGKGVFTRLADAADSVSGRIQDALANPETYGRMEAFFERAMDRFTMWWHIIRDFALGVINIFSAGATEGDKTAAALERTAAAFRAWTGDAANRKKVTAFFERSRELASRIWGIITEIAKGLAGIANGPGMAAVSGLIDRLKEKTGGTGPLSGLISGFGNTVLVKGIEGIHGILDVLDGTKDPGSPLEKIANALSKLSGLNPALDIFLDILTWILDKLVWAKDNIPGVSAIFAGLAAVIAVRSIGKSLGLGAVFNGIATAVGFVIDQRSGVPAATRELRTIRDHIGAPVKGSKSSLWNRITGVGNAGKEAGGDLRKATGDFSHFQDAGIGPLKQLVKNCYVTAGRIENIGIAALGAGDQAKKAAPGLGDGADAIGDLKDEAKEASSGAIDTVGREVESAGKKAESSAPRMARMSDAMGKAAETSAILGGGLWAISSIAGEESGLGKALTTIGQGLLAFGAIAEIGSLLMGINFAAVAAGIKSVSLAILTSPITWIVVAVVALGVALYTLYKKNETFRKFIDGLWQTMQKAWDKILGVLKSVVSWVGDKLLGIFNALWQTIQTVWDAIVTATVWAWQTVIGPLLRGIGDIFTNYVIPALQTLWSVAVTVFNAIGTVVSFVWTNILKPIFDLVAWTITNIVMPIFSALWAIVKDVFNGIGAAISLWWNYYAKPIFALVKWYITNIVMPIFSALWAIVKDVFNGISKAITWAWENVIQPVFQAVWGFITDKVVPIFQSVWSTVKDVFDKVGGKVDSVWKDKIKPVFQKIWDFVEDKLKPIFTSLSDGISTAFDTISEAIPKAFEGMKKALGTALRAVGNIIAPILRGVATVADKVGMDELAKSLRGTAEGTDKWGEYASGGQLPEHAAGTRFANAKRTKVGAGFKTGTPRAIVGEGSRYPEYVIPTDPKYRTRAISLLAGAAGDLSRGPKGRGRNDLAATAAAPNGRQRPKELGLGGLVDDIKSVGGAVVGGVSSATGKVVDAARGIGAYALESIWPNMPKEWLGDGVGGIPGNLFQSLRDKVIAAIRGVAITDFGAVWDSAKGMAASQAAVDPNKVKGINPVFLEMFHAWNGDVGNKFSILSGWRSTEKQAELYARYLAGTGNLAAPPGRSNHEKGFAIDVSPGTGWAPRYLDPARKRGLHFPVRGEDWHVEPINIAAALAETRRRREPGAQGWGGVPLAKGGLLASGLMDNVPGLINGGIVTSDTLARIGELGRPEAIVPLESAAGRRLLGDGAPIHLTVEVDARGATDPEAVEKAVEKGIDKALDKLAELEEVGA